MKIAGLVPFTLIDYPDKVAATVFTQGCNFRCPFCHNPKLLPINADPSSLMPEEKFFEFLVQRRGKLDGIVVSGGEPTIHHDLVNFLYDIRKLGFLTKLDTNGSRPELLQQLISDKLLDFVAMDIKAPLTSYCKLAGRPVATDKILNSISIISHSNIPHQFRTTVDQSLLTPDDLDSIKKLIPPNSIHIFQPARTRGLRPWTRYHAV